MTIPPRGPRRVLWVVLVTNSAWGMGLGCRPAATRPATWAMSAMTTAPVSSAAFRTAAKSRVRGYALAPTTMTFGRCCFASSRSAS